MLNSAAARRARPAWRILHAKVEPDSNAGAGCRYKLQVQMAMLDGAINAAEENLLKQTRAALGVTDAQHADLVHKFGVLGPTPNPTPKDGNKDEEKVGFGVAAEEEEEKEEDPVPATSDAGGDTPSLQDILVSSAGSSDSLAASLKPVAEGSSSDGDGALPRLCDDVALEDDDGLPVRGATVKRKVNPAAASAERDGAAGTPSLQDVLASSAGNSASLAASLKPVSDGRGGGGGGNTASNPAAASPAEGETLMDMITSGAGMVSLKPVPKEADEKEKSSEPLNPTDFKAHLENKFASEITWKQAASFDKGSAPAEVVSTAEKARLARQARDLAAQDLEDEKIQARKQHNKDYIAARCLAAKKAQLEEEETGKIAKLQEDLAAADTQQKEEALAMKAQLEEALAADKIRLDKVDAAERERAAKIANKAKKDAAAQALVTAAAQRRAASEKLEADKRAALETRIAANKSRNQKAQAAALLLQEQQAAKKVAALEKKLISIAGTTAVMPIDQTSIGLTFDAFLAAHDISEIIESFENVLHATDITLDGGPGFFTELHNKLVPQLNFKQGKLFAVLMQKKRMIQARTERQELVGVKCIIAGAGPVGLRTALEFALMGADVTIIEKRNSFKRINILHLWAWACEDLKNLGFTGSDLFSTGGTNHIATRKLQTVLTRLVLLLGVRIYTGLTFDSVQAPKSNPGMHIVKTKKYKDGGFQARMGVLEANVLIDAAGTAAPIVKYYTMKQTPIRLSNALGLVAHFKRAPGERKTKEFSHSRQYKQKQFDALEAKGLHLENIVHYKRDTHYVVMTPTTDALIAYGALKESKPSAREVVARGNVNMGKLREFAREVAIFWGMPKSCEFIDDERQAAQIFDFSQRTSTDESMHVVESGKSQLLVFVCGDALIEPFWPEGLGINRGFLSALDAAYVVQTYFSEGEVSPDLIDEMVALRDTLFKIQSDLSGNTKKRVLKEDHRKYTLMPESRYKQYARPKIQKNKAKSGWAQRPAKPRVRVPQQTVTAPERRKTLVNPVDRLHSLLDGTADDDVVTRNNTTNTEDGGVVTHDRNEAAEKDKAVMREMVLIETKRTKDHLAREWLLAEKEAVEQEKQLERDLKHRDRAQKKASNEQKAGLDKIDRVKREAVLKKIAEDKARNKQAQKAERAAADAMRKKERGAKERQITDAQDKAMAAARKTRERVESGAMTVSAFKMLPPSLANDALYEVTPVPPISRGGKKAEEVRATVASDVGIFLMSWTDGQINELIKWIEYFACLHVKYHEKSGLLELTGTCDRLREQRQKCDVFCEQLQQAWRDVLEPENITGPLKKKRYPGLNRGAFPKHCVIFGADAADHEEIPVGFMIANPADAYPIMVLDMVDIFSFDTGHGDGVARIDQTFNLFWVVTHELLGHSYFGLDHDAPKNLPGQVRYDQESYSLANYDYKNDATIQLMNSWRCSLGLPVRLQHPAFQRHGRSSVTREYIFIDYAPESEAFVGRPLDPQLPSRFKRIQIAKKMRANLGRVLELPDNLRDTLEYPIVTYEDDDSNKYNVRISQFVAGLKGKPPTYEQMTALLASIDRTTTSLRALRHANRIGITPEQKAEVMEAADQELKEFIAEWAKHDTEKLVGDIESFSRRQEQVEERVKKSRRFSAAEATGASIGRGRASGRASLVDCGHNARGLHIHAP